MGGYIKLREIERENNEVYVLTGRTLGCDGRSILGVFSSMDGLKKAREYFNEHGYGDFDFTVTSMDEY